MLRWNTALTSTNDTEVSIDKYSFAVELKHACNKGVCSDFLDCRQAVQQP